MKWWKQPRPYRKREGSRPPGMQGQLDPVQRGWLRLVIAHMVRTDEQVSNADIVEAFAEQSGVRVTEGTIRRHRSELRLPPAPMGNPRHRRAG